MSSSSTKDWRRHTEDYFRETSIHGFRYVVDSASLTEKIVWVITIILAFIYCSLFAYNTIQEAQENPIVSSIEVIDGKLVNFPAVTVYPGERQKNRRKSHVSYRYVTMVMNALEFSCRGSRFETFWERENYSGSRCDNRTRQIKEDFRPLIENTVQKVLLAWEENTQNGRHILTHQELERNANDKRGSNSAFLAAIKPEFCHLSHMYQDGPSEDQMEGFLKVLTDTFQASPIKTELTLVEFLQNITLQMTGKLLKAENETICSFKAIQDSPFAPWLSAIIMQTWNLRLDLGDLIEYSYLSQLDQNLFWYIAPNNAKGNSSTITDEIIENLIGSDSPLSLHDVITYAMAWPFPSISQDFYNGIRGDACKDMDEQNERLKCLKKLIEGEMMPVALKALKYTNQPTHQQVSNTGYAQDVEKALELTDGYPKRCSLEQGSCLQPDPFLKFCSYDYTKPDLFRRKLDSCAIFRQIYGIKETAYTFNSAEFFKIYSRNPYNNLMEKEVFHTEDQNIDFKSRKILDFLIFPDTADKFFQGDVPQPSLAIHHPTQFPGLPIHLEPGFKYDIILTPSLITTDAAIIDIPIDKRQCRFASERISQDSVFSNYSQNACIYECRLRQVYEEAGCLPWDVPHFESPISICSWADKSFEILFPRSNPDKCGHCLPDCDLTNYLPLVSKSPLSDALDHLRLIPPVHPMLRFLNRQEYTPMGEGKLGWDKLLTRVTIQMDTSSVIRTRKLKRTTFTDLVANLGGVVGLFSGMSMLSLMEVIVWTCRGIFVSRKMSADEATEKNQNDEPKEKLKHVDETTELNFDDVKVSE